MSNDAHRPQRSNRAYLAAVEPTTPAGWHLPTYKERFAIEGNPSVPCPRCGRSTPADMLVDVTPLNGSDDYWCDACRERAYATGEVTREALHVAHGAPAAVVTRARDVEKAHGRRKSNAGGGR